VPRRTAQTLVEQEDPDEDRDDRIRDRDGRDRRRQSSCPERDLLDDEAQHADDRKGVDLPATDALVGQPVAER
jgi:hypothetical protein